MVKVKLGVSDFQMLFLKVKAVSLQSVLFFSVFKLVLSLLRLFLQWRFFFSQVFRAAFCVSKWWSGGVYFTNAYE